MELDREFLQYHQEEWADKNRHAVVQMMKLLAVERPASFARAFVLDKPEGSEERKAMTGILKFLNPEFYEIYREVLGESTYSDDINVPSIDDEGTDRE